MKVYLIGVVVMAILTVWVIGVRKLITFIRVNTSANIVGFLLVAATSWAGVVVSIISLIANRIKK